MNCTNDVVGYGVSLKVFKINFKTFETVVRIVN